MLEILGKASLGGALLLIAIWCVCRALPRLPATARFWLWWLACAKLLLGLLILTPITVVLPVSAQLLPVHPLLPVVPVETAPIHNPQATVGPETTAPNEEIGPARTTLVPTRHVFDVAPILIGVWLGGAALVFFWQLVPTLTLRRAIQQGIAVSLGETLEEIAQRVGVRRLPRVVLTSGIPGPLVVGIFRPTILLPVSLVPNLTPAEVRLVLAHELSHIRRGDLWLALLPAAVRCLFWFLPPVWLACREIALCREEVCDATALRATDAAPAVYGALLLKAAIPAGKPLPLTAPGMAAVHFVAVRRRLTALTGKPSRVLRTLGALAIAVTCLALVPLRLAARAETLVSQLIAPESTPHYRLQDLGTLGGAQSDALAVSPDGGYVAGAALLRTAARGHATLWGGAGGPKDLSADSTLPRSIAYAVNRRGQVAAFAYNQQNRPSAFLWDGKRIYLGGFDGYRFGRALDVNTAGQVVGSVQRANLDAGALPTRAFLWEAGRMTDLGTLGGPYSTALAISDRGLIVGKADLPRPMDSTTGETHAFLREGGRMRDLGTLPGGQNSVASDVNDRAQVVGWSESARGRRAFLWQDGAMTELPVPFGARETEACAINADGWVAGAAVVGDTRRALLWRPILGGYEVTDLTSDLASDGEPVSVEVARDISDRGEVVGVGTVGGKRRALLLLPSATPSGV